MQAGICCAIMPLNNGLEALSDNLEILPIAETRVDSQLALIMRQQEPVSTPAENASPRRRGFWLRPVPATTSDILQSNAPRSGAEDPYRQHHHQHTDDDKANHPRRAGVLQNNADQDAGHRGGEPAERVAEADGAGANMGREDLGPVGVVADGQPGVGR